MSVVSKANKNEFKTREVVLKSLIKSYALEAIWLRSEQEFKNHLTNLNNEIAANCNKISTSISLKDINRILNTLEQKGKVLGLGNIRFDQVERAYLKYQSMSPLIDMTSFIYSVAMAVKGNPNPIIRKLLIKSSNKINANYVALTYIIGHFSLLLYGEDIDLLETLSVSNEDPIDSFDPIIKLLNINHVKDLSKLLKLDIDINLPIEEARLKIVKELNYHSSNKVKYLYNKTFGENTSNYKSVLLALCNDLKVEVKYTEDTEDIEEKLVMRVLQETVERLTPEQKLELDEKLSSLNKSTINKELLTSGGTLAVIVGLKASGFGVYLAASSALGAISNGLGISLAFSTYTTMSTIIAGFLGPVGIGAAGLGLIASLSSAEPKKVLPAVIYIAMLRKELEIEELQEPIKSRKLLYTCIILTIISLVAIIQYYFGSNLLP